MMASQLSRYLTSTRFLGLPRLSGDWLTKTSLSCQENKTFRSLTATQSPCAAAVCCRTDRADLLPEELSSSCLKLPVDFTVQQPLGACLDEASSDFSSQSIKFIGQEDLISTSRLMAVYTDIRQLERDEILHRIVEDVSGYGLVHMSDKLKEGSCSNASSKESNGRMPDTDQRPNTDRLHLVKDYMAKEIPQVLFKRHEYRMYSQDVIFENNWTLGQPYTVIGLTAYALQLLKARCYFHGKYARVQVSVLSGTVDEVAGSVAIRWRVEGLPQIKAFMFWKYLPFRVKAKAKDESEWIDGLSTFYINKKGFIYKHRLDRMMPDKDAVEKLGLAKPVTPLGLQ